MINMRFLPCGEKYFVMGFFLLFFFLSLSTHSNSSSTPVVLHSLTFLLPCTSGPRAGNRAGQRTEAPCRDPEEHAQGRPQTQGTRLPGRWGSQEPGETPGHRGQTPEQDQDLQETSRGGCKYSMPFKILQEIWKTLILYNVLIYERRLSRLGQTFQGLMKQRVNP